jgi:hypothetical protein
MYLYCRREISRYLLAPGDLRPHIAILIASLGLTLLLWMGMTV